MECMTCLPNPRYERRPNELHPSPPLGPNDKPTIFMIKGGPTDRDSNRAHRRRCDSLKEYVPEGGEVHEVGHVYGGAVMKFGVDDYTSLQQPHTDALVIKAVIGSYNVERVFVDTGSSMDVLFKKCLEQMRLGVRMDPVETSLFGLTGESVPVRGQVQLQMVLGEGASRQS